MAITPPYPCSEKLRGRLRDLPKVAQLVSEAQPLPQTPGLSICTTVDIQWVFKTVLGGSLFPTYLPKQPLKEACPALLSLSGSLPLPSSAIPDFGPQGHW